jgi:hypothetical protein
MASRSRIAGSFALAALDPEEEPRLGQFCHGAAAAAAHGLGSG